MKYNQIIRFNRVRARDVSIIILLTQHLLIQMRQRLDLDSLLRKYQTSYSPRNQLESKHYYPEQNGRAKGNKLKTEPNQYAGSSPYFQVGRARQEPELYSTRDKVASISFQMSKSQCEALLQGVREELQNQSRLIDGFILRCMDQVTQKFNRQHQQLRRDLLSMVQQLLQQNKKSALEMIDSYRRQFPKQYSPVSQKMAGVEQEVKRLHNSLNTADFKKTIAQIVTKDFNDTIRRLRQQIISANHSFQQSLSSIQTDRARIVKIQDSLQKIYSWKGVDAVKMSDDRQDFMSTERRNSSKRKIFDQKGSKMAMTQRGQGSQHSAPKKMRKTFFNFGSQQ